MAEDDAVPAADAAEQDTVVAGEQPAEEEIGVVGERPEADVIEQRMLVRTEQSARRPDLGAEVPEADAWEQAIEEPFDEDQRD